MIKSINIKDPIESHVQRAVEVDIEFNNGEKRWCFFLTPQGAATHMFLVSEISKEIIEKAIKQVEKQGELEQCTLPVK